MKIGDENIGQYEVEYTAEEVKGAIVSHCPRGWDLWYMDEQEVWHMPADAPEELKKEFAAWAWMRILAYREGKIID